VPAVEETRRGNVDLIDRLFTLSNRSAIGDGTALSELIAAYHGDADVRPFLNAEDGALETPDLIRRYFARVKRDCFVWFIYADELQEHGDDVLALGGMRTVDKATHEDRERTVGWLFEVLEGKVKAVHAFASHSEARSAVRKRG
jgi:hypothetical protein